MRIGVVISTFNHLSDLRECLYRVSSEDPYAIYVTDDGSGDGTGEFLAGWAGCERARVRIVRNARKNRYDIEGSHVNYMRGYGWLANAGCDWMLRIGDDVMLEPDSIRRLVKLAEGAGNEYASGRIRGETADFRDAFSILRPGLFFQWKHAFDGVPYAMHSVLRAGAEARRSCGFHPEVSVGVTRRTGERYDSGVWVMRGRVMRYVGNTVPFTLARAARHPAAGVHLLRGYFGTGERCPPMITDNTRRTEWGRIRGMVCHG